MCGVDLITSENQIVLRLLGRSGEIDAMMSLLCSFGLRKRSTVYKFGIFRKL